MPQYWHTAMKQINTDSLNSCQTAGGNKIIEKIFGKFEQSEYVG